MDHVNDFLWREGVDVLAVCDVDGKRRQEAVEKVDGKYSERKRSGEFRGCAPYNDYREILARGDIDAVLVATPDHWHVPIANAAARAGKDVYCEKPLSLNVAQGRSLVSTFARHGRVFQTGSWQRSQDSFRRACELVRNGRIGRVRTVEVTVVGGQSIGPQPVQPVPEGFDYDMWLGPAPWAPYTEKRCHFQFRWITDYSGGGVTDWGAHHLDITLWALGLDGSGPVAVEGAGDFPREGIYDNAVSFRVRYEMPDGVVVNMRNDYPHYIRFEGDKGWIKIWREGFEADPAPLVRERIRPGEMRLYRSNNHKDNWLECIRTRRETITPPEAAHRAASMCHLGNIAMRLGRKLKWDPAAERFVGDAGANEMLDRPMRAPWHL
jgi:predicted dehydrogenase